MCITLSNFIPTLLNVLFDTFYICAWVCFLGLQFYKMFVYPLKQEISYLKTQHDILYCAIKKLKTIIDIDNKTFGKRLNKIKEQLSKSYQE